MPTPGPQPPTALSGPDKEHLANGRFGLNDRVTPTPCHRKGQAKGFQPAPGVPPPWPGFQPQTKSMSGVDHSMPPPTTPHRQGVSFAVPGVAGSAGIQEYRSVEAAQPRFSQRLRSASAGSRQRTSTASTSPQAKPRQEKQSPSARSESGPGKAPASPAVFSQISHAWPLEHMGPWKTNRPAKSARTRAPVSNLPRNLPVKRYDGDPLGRADVQHALLCHLFADKRRVFTNPRPGDCGQPGPAGASSGANAGVSTLVWPYGMSVGCLRRSDETPEEFEEWKNNKARYDKWKRRMDRKHKASQPAEESAAAKDGDAEKGEKSNEEEEEDELTAPSPKEELANEPEEEDDSELLDENEFAKPGSDLLTFKELYIEALLNSGKCTKSMRDKMIADEEYAEDFAKVCLLVNVGRINTTLAFYPEMKTVLRSYHPLPSVQNNENTRRNLQDAPRMKSLLKAVLLDNERPGVPTAGPGAGQPPKPPRVNALSEEAPGDLKEVIKRLRDGTKPPTSVVTLIFLLSLHANEITSSHFVEPHDSYSLFYPHADYPLPSKQRAQAFLWLLYHYLEGPAAKPPGEQENPFDDDHSTESTKLAREAYETMSEDEKVKQQSQPWKGLVNLEWVAWKAEDDKRNEAAGTGTPGADPSLPLAVKEEKDTPAAATATPTDADGDVLMKDAEPAVPSSSSDGDKASEEPLPFEPISHTHMQLVPSLDLIPYEQAARENIDTEEEITWGKQMQSERAAFLAKFQEEEAAKAATGSQAAASPVPSTGTASGKGKKSGGPAANLKREDAERGGTPSDVEASFASNRGKKRPVHPLAGGAGDLSKRSRGTPVGYEASPDVSVSYSFAAHQLTAVSENAYLGNVGDGRSRVRNSLWDLDLSLPRHQMHESMTRIAWGRILDRAQRGVGDACYESDDEDFAEEEAASGDRSRGEVCRILKSLREVVRHDVFDGPARAVEDPVSDDEEDFPLARNGASVMQQG